MYTEYMYYVHSMYVHSMYYVHGTSAHREYAGLPSSPIQTPETKTKQLGKSRSREQTGVVSTWSMM